jgi:hypothetical protein
VHGVDEDAGNQEPGENEENIDTHPAAAPDPRCNLHRPGFLVRGVEGVEDEDKQDREAAKAIQCSVMNVFAARRRGCGLRQD